MQVIEGRFEVQLISSDVLRQFMKFRGLTVRSLAKRAHCSHGTVGNLSSGARKTCRPETARRIEEALDAPPGLLFVPRVSRVLRDRPAA